MQIPQIAAATLAAFLLLQPVIATDEDTNVAVSVDYSCSTSVLTFSPPGDGIISKNSTGYFNSDIENTGNFPSNVTVEYLNVTKQNETYDPGADGLGPVVEYYNGSNVTNLPVDDNLSTQMIDEDSFTYQTQFNATYEIGHYAAHMNVSTSCDLSKANNETRDFENFSIVVHNNFRIVEAYGEGGGVNTTGNKTTNQTFPEDINTTGNQSINDTLPQNVTRPGEETNQPLAGNNDAPGVTPQPEPEPEPEPEPVVVVDVEPVNRTYPATRGMYAPARLRIRNIGNIPVNDLRITPALEGIRPGWDFRAAEVANLSVNETVSREVFVRPPGNTTPGMYVVPVEARDAEGRVDLDFFTLEVRKANFTPRLQILESPRAVTIEANSTQEIPVLLENTGRRKLTGVRAELQNVEDCGSAEIAPAKTIPVNATDSLSINFSAAGSTGSCNATLIVSTEEGAYAFSSINFDVIPAAGGLIPPEQRVPFIAIAWTAVLVAYALLRKRYQLDMIFVQVPFIMLLVGETLILLYMVVNYYGIVQLSFLPF
ncbi:MAG: hypothetical protein ABEJ98_02250 [Candidatus Nanohaloarchaea archaeon]